jgi:diguanylate cyclase (GGDEF)-like protein
MMVWSVQLTAWALPPLAAVLLALWDWDFLWTRRRETGTRALLVLVTATGAWGLLDAVAVMSASHAVQLTATRLTYLPASVAPVAWAWFALEQGDRAKAVLRWPMVLLGIASAAFMALSVDAEGSAWLIRDSFQVVSGEGLAGLHVTHGPAHWTWLGARTVAVLCGTWVLMRNLARSAGERWLIVPTVAAALAAVLAPLAQFMLAPGAAWVDVSSAGFALGASMLRLGVARTRLRNLGPMDRDLVLGRLRDPLVVLDGRGRIVDVNQAARDELALRPYGDVPLDLGTLWARGPAPDSAPPPRIAMPAGASDARVYEVTVTRLGTDDARGRTALLLRDVTVRERMQQDLHQANAALERLAREDSLTGLANRRHFMEVLRRELDRSGRYGHSLAVIMLDLDHFKAVNDTHGHAVGDSVLREAARALRTVCRDVDLAARLGGEELAILLPETDAAGARIVAERARERIAAVAHTAPDGSTVRVTASFGVAAARPEVTSEAVLKAADDALYRAKGAGRNQVAMAR